MLRRRHRVQLESKLGGACVLLFDVCVCVNTFKEVTLENTLQSVKKKYIYNK